MSDRAAAGESVDPTVRNKESRSAATLASAVYLELRHDILCGHLSPGDKLRTEFLRERYKVGNSPVREALNRLSADGFVVREDQKGFRVSPVGEPDLRELTATRCWLEELAVREALKHGESAWEEAIVIAFYRLSKVDRSKTAGEFAANSEWERLHREFHKALLSWSDGGLLLGFCDRLNDHADRYRRLAEKKYRSDRDDLDEHQAIMDACITRDTDRAVRLLHEHYKATERSILESKSIANEMRSSGQAG